MPKELGDIIGPVPYRMAFAGGWIDQPFMSRRNPEPPGSMVTVAVEPTFRWMDRCGMATSTRSVALRHWQGRMPRGDPRHLVRELYDVENRGKSEPSGSRTWLACSTRVCAAWTMTRPSREGFSLCHTNMHGARGCPLAGADHQGAARCAPACRLRAPGGAEPRARRGLPGWESRDGRAGTPSLPWTLPGLASR